MTSYWNWGGGYGKGWHRITHNDARCTSTPPTTPVSTSCLDASKYCVTKGVYDGVLRAAQKAVAAPTGARCTSTQLTASGRRQITVNRLASMMFAVAAWELNGGKTNRALSPMTLSRGDNLNRLNRGRDSHNLMLHSHMTLGGYKRAHWNPGVGLWQLDNFSLPAADVNALRYGHAERSDVGKGGFEVAKYLRYSYCLGVPVYDAWFACGGGKCQATHSSRFSAATDSVEVEIVEGLTNPAGGVEERLCRWGIAGIETRCYLYDLDLKEGYVAVKCCPAGGSGVNAYTPEAAPFISFTDAFTDTVAETKFAVWPKVWPSSSSGLVWPTVTAAGSGETAKTIIRAVRAGENARFSPYNDDNDTTNRGIAHHGLTKLASETVTQYEARIEAKIAVLNGGPLTVNNSSVNYGLGAGGLGPEGWFDGLVNGFDLQVYNCAGSIGDTLVESCWVSANGVSGGG